ncbi:MAG: hypothetical protein QW176_04625 [Candidatus Bathyarchaeia archaeon]
MGMERKDKTLFIAQQNIMLESVGRIVNLKYFIHPLIVQVKWTLRIFGVEDYFMLPSVFERHLCETLSGVVKDLEIRRIEWPFEIRKEPTPVDPEITEYAGSPVEFERLVVDDDVILVHLAPVTRGMIKGNKNLKIVKEDSHGRSP